MPHKTTNRKSTRTHHKSSPQTQYTPATTDDPAEGSVLEVVHSLEKMEPKTQSTRRSK